MSAPKPQKRRIVPIQVADNAPPPPPPSLDKWDRRAEKHVKRAAMEGGRSTKYEKHLKQLHDADYVKRLEKRAVELGYQSERKKRSPSRSGKAAKRPDNRDHGSHHEHLSSLSDYIKAYSRMKTHSKGKSVYDYLKQNFEKGLYYSPLTHRFRRYH